MDCDCRTCPECDAPTLCAKCGQCARHQAHAPGCEGCRARFRAACWRWAGDTRPCPQCGEAGQRLQRAMDLDWWSCPNGHAAWASWQFSYTPKVGG